MNSQKETRDGECLTEELISGYLEGVLTPVVKAACEVHLIGCDRCRENLATLMRLLRTDVDPEEAAHIELAVAAWEGRIVTPPARGWSTGTWRRAFYFGGVAAVVALLTLFLAGRPTAEDLVQDVLQKRRPFDAQMSSQPYLTLNSTRSSEALPSYEGLTEEMANRAADAYRLGRLHLANKDFQKAIEYLTPASADTGASPEIHNDLGVAYLQRAGEDDFEKARRQFETAIATDKNFEPAVFNLALLYEITGMTSAAEQQWERYLELDSTSGWAQEVRNKVKGLR